MSLLNTFETPLVAELVSKAQTRFESAQTKLTMMVANNGPAYAMRWAGDALEAEARYRAIKEVESFYTIEIGDFNPNPAEVQSARQLGREHADKASAKRILDKVRYICAGTSSESEQVREAQAYAWAHNEFVEAFSWAAREQRKAEETTRRNWANERTNALNCAPCRSQVANRAYPETPCIGNSAALHRVNSKRS